VINEWLDIAYLEKDTISYVYNSKIAGVLIRKLKFIYTEAKIHL